MNVLVIVPTHDRKDFLDEAMQSVYAQTMKPRTIVTGNVAPSQPGDYTFVHSDEGLIVKLNTTIAANDCDAFILLSDDDTLLPEYVEKTSAMMETTGADIVYTEFNNEPVTALIRKSIWEKVGGFAEMGFFDWDFYWSCREAGALSIPIREHLFVYRQHEAQMAKHGEWKSDGSWAKWEVAILEKHPKRGQP